MDKYLKAIELTEHPGRFSTEEMQSLLADPEIREIYDTLCVADSAVRKTPHISPQRIDEEFTRFKSRPDVNSKPFHFTKWRAVAAALIAVPSLAALAIGFAVINRSESMGHEKLQTELTTTSMAAASPEETSLAIPSDTVPTITEPVVFENERLGTMLDTISRHYGLRLDTVNSRALDMRLFFPWNPADQPSEVVRQLNNFDRISLKFRDNVLTVM